MILNHHSGEVRLFHRNKKRYSIINPKFTFKSNSKYTPPQILSYEQYFPFDYGKKEHCAISIFLSEGFTRNIRRMINEFNLEVLYKKKLEIKEHFKVEINYLHSLLTLNNSKNNICLLYTSPSPRDLSTSSMPSSA